MTNPKQLARVAGIAATGALALGLFSPGAANADTFVPLPGGEITRALPDGTNVTVRIVGESANISPSMGATPLHRNTWVSATGQVEVSQRALAITTTVGYVVGCQVNIAGGGLNGSGNASSDWEGQRPNVGAGGGANLSLGPGQASAFYILDVEAKNGYGQESHRPFTLNRNTDNASVSWKNSTIGLSGCAGYAQARAFVKAEVETMASKGTVTLWGQPFSLG